MAILGATGSGKTSVMNILARRLVVSRNLRVDGQVLLNGETRGRAWKSNYVQQDDLLFGELTVQETLLFAAKLRMPVGATLRTRAARVALVVRTLGLQAAMDTAVGGELKRGISGGERKRLSLGVELVVDPPLLFLDEPTSGLDAFNAQAVMASLKLLTGTGRTVVVCIHQPRSGITALFDVLLLLSEGLVMYSGLAGHALRFFEQHRFRMPEHTNPSDFYLDVISPSFQTERAEAASRKRIQMLASAYEGHQAEALQQLRAAAADAGPRREHGGEAALNADVDAEKAHAQSTAPAAPRAAAARRWLVELSALFARAARLAGRQRLENGINLVRTTLFSLLLGLIWLQVGHNPRGQVSEVRNLGGLLFFSIVNHSFSGVFGVVFTFASECRLVLRERISGAYKCSPYFVAHLIVELPRVALWSFLHSVVIYWTAGLRANASAFFIFYAVHILVELNAEAITLLFTAATHSEKIASAVAPIPLVISILFGGFFVEPSAIPGFLRWIRDIAYMRWSYVALVRNEYPESRTFDCDGPAGACVEDGAQAVELLIPGAGLGLIGSAWTLAGLLAACWLGTYFVLRVNKPRYDAHV